MTVNAAAQSRPAESLQDRPAHSPPHKKTGPHNKAGKTSRAARAKSFVTRLRQDSPLLVMTAPAVLVLLLFTYIPLLGSVVAFMDYVPFLGFTQSQWVGWDNFTSLFQDDLFWGALRNTFEITFLQLLLFFPVPILIAVLFNSVAMPAVKSFVQSVIYLPHFLSWVIIVALFQQMLGGGGIISRILVTHGMSGIGIMSDPSTFQLLLTSQAIWKDAGWGTIVFLAAIAAIDAQLYESAAIDGAGALRRFWHVTLPGMRPIIILMLILRLGDALTVGFEQILLQRDAVGPGAAEVIDTYVYFNGVQDGNWGVATAAGLLKGVVSLALVLAANKLAHRFGEEGIYRR
ncbi:ABC transporter permease [Streptomyces sp. NPDC058274]|uniref:ABC transporter permease n=1 Tax=Streptomyces sp. NPDC058274 TaxID=3346416 RepID=UPI0036E5A8C5